MENNQQDTDARILVRYIASCADPHNPVPPLQVLQVAIHLLDEFQEHPEHVLSAWDFIDKAQQILQNQNPSQQYYRRTPGYQVVAAMYIMLKVDGLKTIEEEAFSGGAFVYVKLSECVMSIQARAFADCPNLKYIYIPKSTTSIDPTAFDNVSGLTILGKTGSSAENFATANGFVFKVSP